MLSKIKNNKDVIYIFLITRVMFFLLMFLANKNLDEVYKLFDGKFYLAIAEYGYYSIKVTAFFPMIPLILNLFGEIGLIIINNICFLCSLFILKEINKKNKDYLFILLFFAFSPISFFSILYYTESIFFFLTLFSFYLVKNKKFGFFLGIIIGLSVATRNSGSIMFFVIFLTLCFLLYKKEIKILDIIKTYIPATIISCIYPIFLQIKFGSWKMFIDTQYLEWQKIPTNIFKTLQYQYRVIFLGEIHNRPFWLVKYVHIFNELLTITLGIFILFLIVKYLIKIIKNKKINHYDIILILYPIISLICFNSTIKMIEYDTPTISFYRYYLALFPIYILFENIKTKSKKVLSLLMFSFSIIVVFLFSTGSFFY